MEKSVQPKTQVRILAILGQRSHLIDDFPDLTQEDILACLSYAANRERQTLLIQL